MEFDGLTSEELKQLAVDMVEDEGDKYEALLADANAENDDQPAAGHNGETGTQWRDRVGQQMWEDYQAELVRRAIV